MILAILTTVVANGATFTCTPTRVWDGDGPIWCAEGPKIRLAGIAAREIDETCKPGHPCPRSSGRDARDYLVNLLGGSRGRSREGHVLVNGPRLTCVSWGSGKGDRTAASCRVGSTDLSCSMIQAAYAVRWDRYWRGPRCR